MKLQQMKDGSFFVVLPKQIVRAKQWIKGKVLNISFNETGKILITE